MISVPVGRGRKAEIRRLLTFLLSVVASASTVGALAGFGGRSIMARERATDLFMPMALAGICLLYGTAELKGTKWWVPSRKWIIPQRWALFGNLRFTIVFGLLLGAGFFTVLPFVGYHVLVISCFLHADPVWAGSLMAVFGLARALPVLITPVAYSRVFGVYDSRAAYQANSWLTRMDYTLSRARAIVLFAFAASLMATCLSSTSP